MGIIKKIWKQLDNALPGEKNGKPRIKFNTIKSLEEADDGRIIISHERGHIITSVERLSEEERAELRKFLERATEVVEEEER